MDNEQILMRVQESRDLIAKLSEEDMLLADGTVLLAGASHRPTLAILDETIFLMKGGYLSIRNPSSSSERLLTNSLASKKRLNNISICASSTSPESE